MNDFVKIEDYPDVDISPLEINFVSSGICDKKLFIYPDRAELKTANFNLFFCIPLILLFLIFLPMLSLKIYIVEFSFQLFLVLFTGLGAFSFCLGHYLLKKFSTKVIFDMKSSTVSILKDNRLENIVKRVPTNQVSEKLPMNELQCIQICYWKFSHNNAYQLNLCFAGNKRFNIMSRNSKYQVVKISRKIAEYTGVGIIDCVKLNKNSFKR